MIHRNSGPTFSKVIGALQICMEPIEVGKSG
jgi:hypothetical protein